MTYEVELRGVKKRFGSLEALKGVNLRIERGEKVGLLGPNGAGKTTLLRIILGLISPTSGEVLVKGKSVLDHGIELRRIMGYLPEETHLYDKLTVKYFLQFFSDLYDVERSKIYEVMEILGISSLKERKIGTLSRGNRRRVAIARALLNDPEILLLDEPTTGLDPRTSRDIWGLISKMDGKTIIMSTHYVGEVDRLCSRVVVMKDGEIVVCGSKEDVISRASQDAGRDLDLEGAYLFYTR
ncbi:ABC transporter ATP-binding protein [Thermococci archaeon]|nr:MAG: ABC transporter ATP-binding protein [Thermococci archaeon]RLF92835.1 MAG: ABC transporter ATP-binding protein [Thermococci archaeon]